MILVIKLLGYMPGLIKTPFKMMWRCVGDTELCLKHADISQREHKYCLKLSRFNDRIH